MSSVQRDNATETLELFNALAEPTRRGIIELLATKGQLSATDIYDNFDVSRPAISQHLKVLRKANFVRVEKRAQQRIYQINRGAMSELEDWVQKMTKRYDARYDALDKLLEAEKKKLAKGGEKKGVRQKLLPNLASKSSSSQGSLTHLASSSSKHTQTPSSTLSGLDHEDSQ